MTTRTKPRTALTGTAHQKSTHIIDTGGTIQATKDQTVSGKVDGATGTIAS